MSKGPLPYVDVYLDGKNSSDEEENGIQESSSKPLMSNRKPKKTKIQVHDPVYKSLIYKKRKRCILKLFYLLLALISVSLFVFVLFKVIHDSLHPLADDKRENRAGSESTNQKVVPCSGFDVEPVWIQNFPALTTETAVRLIDANRDGILDVIFGFGTMAYSPSANQKLLCKIYYNNELPCFGGLLALDGNTGDELWRHYTHAEMYAVNCEEDIDKDGVKDCLAAGRDGQFELVNGATGALMWTFDDNEPIQEYSSNMYTPQYIEDIDDDNVPDVINIFGGDPIRKTGVHAKSIAKIIILSGRTGKILVWSEVPDKLESYYSPQVYTKGDGTKVVLFGTGGETHGGSLFVVSLKDVLKGSLQKATVLYTNNLKGIMTPPVLVDLTNDGVVDIISVSFNGTVLAIDGESYEFIWNTTVPFSESFSTPGAGYFNDDDVPDFMIIFNYGPGFPLYYYSQVTILDGRNGQPLFDQPMHTSGSIYSSSISVSFEGHGNDAFIYSSLICAGHDEDSIKFNYEHGLIAGTESRSNFCKDKFGTNYVTRQYIMNQNIHMPGNVIYDSSHYFEMEHSNEFNATKLAMTFLVDHPHIEDKVIMNAIDRHHKTSNHKLHKSSKTKQVDSDDDDDDAINTFLNNFRENFDDEDKKSMIEKLLEDAGYRLDENGVLVSEDFVSPYTPLDHSKKNSFTSQQDNNSSYPRSIHDDYFKRGHNDGPYKLQHEIDRTRRNLATKDLNPLTETVDKLFEESQFHDRESFSTSKRRKRRHLGAHDAEGAQRLISTGALAPPLDPESVQNGDSIDIVFAVYWFYPPQDDLILPEEEDCIKRYMANEVQRMDPENKFYGMDHDSYMNHVDDICVLGENEERLKKYSETIEPLNLYPFNLDAGILTVYRLRLKCKCNLSKDTSTSAKRCAKILPYDRQRWPAYLGKHTNCSFDP